MEKVGNIRLMDGGKTNTKYMVKIAILSAIAYVLYLFEIPITSALKFDFSDIVAIIGGVMLGPVAGILIELIKNLVRFVLYNSGTGGIGEFANFAVGVAYVIPFCILFNKKHLNSVKRYVISGIGAILSMTIIASVLNFYIFIPLYLGMNETGEKMGLIISTFGPMNLIKGSIMCIVGYIVIKAFRPLITRL